MEQVCLLQWKIMVKQSRCGTSVETTRLSKEANKLRHSLLVGHSDFCHVAVATCIMTCRAHECDQAQTCCVITETHKLKQDDVHEHPPEVFTL